MGAWAMPEQQGFPNAAGPHEHQSDFHVFVMNRKEGVLQFPELTDGPHAPNRSSGSPLAAPTRSAAGRYSCWSPSKWPNERQVTAEAWRTGLGSSARSLTGRGAPPARALSSEPSSTRPTACLAGSAQRRASSWPGCSSSGALTTWPSLAASANRPMTSSGGVGFLPAGRPEWMPADRPEVDYSAYHWKLVFTVIAPLWCPKIPSSAACV